MNQKFFIFRSFLCLTLVASLLGTSGEAAASIAFISSDLTARPLIHLPHVARPQHHAAYFTEQAIVEQLITQHLVAGKIAVGRFYSRALPQLRGWATRPVHPKTPYLKGVDVLAFALTAALIIPARAMGLFGPSDPAILMGCGNFVMFGMRSVLALLLLMRDPSSSLFERGVLSLGGYFMSKVQVEVPKNKQIAGFTIGDNKVSVWKYFGIKDVVLKRDDPVSLLFDPLTELAKKVQAESPESTPMIPASVEIHSRFATTGDDGSTLDELARDAQPGIAPGGFELRWEHRKDGVLEPMYVWVEQHYQFNGDLYKTLLVQLKMLLEHGKIGEQQREELKGLYAELQALDPEMRVKDKAEQERYKALFVRLFKAMDQATKNQEARDRLIRWLGYDPKEISGGDAPLMALFQKMYYTERLWHSSIVYAMFAHISKPGDAWDKNPPLKQMRQWEVLFHHAFKIFMKEHPEMDWSPSRSDADLTRLTAQSAAFSRYMESLLTSSSAHRIAFIEKTNGSVDLGVFKDINDTLGDNVTPFLKATTTAFVRNSLPYAALREMKPRVDGTFGGSNLSTLNPPGSRVMSVTTSNGQGIVFTFSEDGELAALSSDRRIQYQLSEADAKDALILDDTGNESLAAGMDENGKTVITLYRGPDSVPVSEEELRRTRLRPLRELEDPEVLADASGLPDVGRVESGIRGAAMQIDAVHENWENVRQGVRTPNRQPVAEVIRVSIQQRIYESIRKQIGVNERALSLELEEKLWEEAEALSRESVANEKTESEILRETERIAQEVEATIIRRAPLRVAWHALPDLFKDIISLAQSGHGAERKEQLRLLREIVIKAVGAFRLGSRSGRLEAQAYDFVLVATESSQLAVEKFAKYTLGPLLGMNVLVLSGNEFLAKADQYRSDPEEFLRALKINSMRTPIVIASDSAETFEAGVDSAWAVATVREVFTVTGNRNNRLADRVKKMRAMTTHNSGGKNKDSFKAYVGMLQTFNELGLYWGEMVTSRFKTGGKRWRRAPFFQTPFKHSDFSILKRSNSRFVKDVAPEILGYRGSGQSGEYADRKKLEAAGEHRGTRQLEMVRLWILEKIYLLMTPLLSLGISYVLVKCQIFGIMPGFASEVISIILGFSIGLALLMGMRSVRRKLGWHAPKTLAGFGPPVFVFSDLYRYVYHFWTLYARTGMGKSYGINSASFLESSVDDFIDDMKALANRRGVVLVGRPGIDHHNPDGIHHDIFETDDIASETIGRQLKSISNLPFRWMKYFGFKPVGPEITMLGHYVPGRDKWWRMGRDMDVDFAPHNHLWTPPGTQFADMPDYLVRYYEENYGGFGRLLGGIRVISAQIKKVSEHRPRFPANEFQGNFFIKSTAGPRPGNRVLAWVQRMAPRLVHIVPEGGEPEYISPSPIKVHEHPLDAAWPSDLPFPGSGEMHHHTPRTRVATRLPGQSDTVQRETPLAPSGGSLSAESPSSQPEGPSSGKEALEGDVKPPLSTVRGTIDAERMKTLLGNLPSTRHPRSSGNRQTSLLMKDLEKPSQSQIQWGPILVEGDGTWDLPQDATKPPEGVFKILDRLIVSALKGVTLADPFVLWVDQISDRAAHSERHPDSSPFAGEITLDSDLMEDVVRGVPFAAETAFLELVEETRHLAEPASPDESRFEFEVAMLWVKVQAFLSNFDETEQQGIIEYLRTRIYDPADLGLADVYEEAARIFAQTLSDSSVRPGADVRTVASRMESRLRAYVEKAFAYEKRFSAPPVPTPTKERSSLLGFVRSTLRVVPWKMVAATSWKMVTATTGFLLLAPTEIVPWVAGTVIVAIVTVGGLGWFIRSGFIGGLVKRLPPMISFARSSIAPRLAGAFSIRRLVVLGVLSLIGYGAWMTAGTVYRVGIGGLPWMPALAVMGIGAVTYILYGIAASARWRRSVLLLAVLSILYSESSHSRGSFWPSLPRWSGLERTVPATPVNPTVQAVPSAPSAQPAPQPTPQIPAGLKAVKPPRTVGKNPREGLEKLITQLRHEYPVVRSILGNPGDQIWGEKGAALILWRDYILPMSKTSQWDKLDPNETFDLSQLYLDALAKSSSTARPSRRSSLRDSLGSGAFTGLWGFVVPVFHGRTKSRRPLAVAA